MYLHTQQQVIKGFDACNVCALNKCTTTAEAVAAGHRALWMFGACLVWLRPSSCHMILLSARPSDERAHAVDNIVGQETDAQSISHLTTPEQKSAVPKGDVGLCQGPTQAVRWLQCLFCLRKSQAAGKLRREQWIGGQHHLHLG